MHDHDHNQPDHDHTELNSAQVQLASQVKLGSESEAIDDIQPDHEQQLLDDVVLYLQEKCYRDVARW